VIRRALVATSTGTFPGLSPAVRGAGGLKGSLDEGRKRVSSADGRGSWVDEIPMPIAPLRPGCFGELAGSRPSQDRSVEPATM